MTQHDSLPDLPLKRSAATGAKAIQQVFDKMLIAKDQRSYPLKLPGAVEIPFESGNKKIPAGPILFNCVHCKEIHEASAWGLCLKCGGYACRDSVNTP